MFRGCPGAVPNNTCGTDIDCEDKVARYYNVILRNAGTITLDMDPEIDSLSMQGRSRSSSSAGPTR